MPNAERRRRHERWLEELTAIPTAAGREDRVIRRVTTWVRERPDLALRSDRAGNLLITRSGPRTGRPIFVTAHLDHPAFVVRRVLDPRTLELEFRGGVQDAYFEEARIEVFDGDDAAHRATILALDAKAKPFKRVTARLTRPVSTIGTGDVGRWALAGKIPRIEKGILHTHACDDLAAVAAALATLDVLRGRRGASNVGVLLTRAEEVGFIGTLRVCADKSVPARSRLICLENSRSFSDSPIGGGPILRVGDKMSVFDPGLTNRIADLLAAHAGKHPGFTWQRKLMPGGTCEATAFAAHGFESTCICLPLGNYHNMTAIDAVAAGRRPARVGPEKIAVADYHGMIDMLAICVTQLDSARLPSIGVKLGKLLSRFGHVLDR